MPNVAGFVHRKSMLYETGVEYGDYTMNHVQGCAHGCLYPCYAYLQKKRFGQVKTYEDWMQPFLVENTLALLHQEIPRLKNKIQSVQLCFTTDPFMLGYEEVSKMSLSAIKLLNENNIKCTVLTKGILPAELADRKKYPVNNEYGITLITLDEAYRKKVEPNASPIEERINALKVLHDAGRNTWISMEPYPTPNLIEQDLLQVLDKISFVDKIIFGRTNYCKDVSQGYPDNKRFYNDSAKKVIEFCKERGINYHIKNKTIT